MSLLRIFLIAITVFISPQAHAGFYVPVSEARGMAAYRISRDTTLAHQGGPRYKHKKVTMKRAHFYAVLGFFPLFFPVVPSLVRRYLGYRQFPPGFFLFYGILLLGLALLLLTPWATAGWVAVAEYLLIGAAIAYGELRLLRTGRLLPVNGRYFTELPSGPPPHF